MSNQSLTQLVTRCLYESERPLDAREIARHLLNERWLTGIQLDALIERLHLLLEVDAHTRGETARFIRRGSGYTLLDTGEQPVLVIEPPAPPSPPSSSTSSIRPLDKLDPSSSVSSSQALPTSMEPKRHEFETHTNGLSDLPHVALKQYPLAHQVSTLLQITHGEKKSIIDSIRRALRRSFKQERSSDSPSAELGVLDSLTGQNALVAKRIWEGSGRLISPSSFEASWHLIESYKLMNTSEDGRWQVTPAGITLMSSDGGMSSPDAQVLLRSLDENEGLLNLMLMCLERGALPIETLEEEWSSFLKQKGHRRDRTWIKIAVFTRLKHLAARGLMSRQLGGWNLTEEGLSWLRSGGLEAPSADYHALEEVWSALEKQRLIARESVHALLNRMDPHRFEELICALLERMGYEEIFLTPRSHDLGVDVVAKIELGITSVREVVQVKRQHRPIHRPVLDALRGSLHRFEAVRGTLITTSSFSHGTQKASFERGAAPVTLIDGERLIDLLMTHSLGFRPVQLKVWQVDPKTFEEESGRQWPRWEIQRTIE